MAIINRKDIIAQDAEQPFDKLIAQYDVLIKKNDDLVKSSKELQSAYANLKKTNDGSEAQKLIKVNNELEAANRKLIKSESDQNKQLALIKVATQQANREASEAAKYALQQKGAYDKLVKSTNDAQKNYKNLAVQLGENSKQTKKALIEFQKLDNQLSKVNKAARDGHKDVGRYTTAFKGLGSQFLGALGLTALVSSFVNVIKNAGKIFVNFEKNSSKLAAILGKTKDEIKSLTEQAKTLGATTAYTASQVIDADTELAKLGFTAKQIEQSIPGILSLAAATGSDLAPAAELAASTLRIFNMDASEMGKVSDILAKSTTISSLSMEKLATIMPTVGKTAQLAGVSLERTAALAGTLTDRGLDASTAATSLRNIFLELSAKGLTWEQAMKKINSSTDKNKAAMDLFGKRAAAAGSILAETAVSTDALTTSLENSNGAAKQMADTMLNNLAGDMTIAQSAWEGFILSLEDGNGVISRVLRGATQFFTGLLEQLTNLNKESYRTAKNAKDIGGITDITAKALEKQEKTLQAITDVEERKKKANEIRLKLEKAINDESLKALDAKKKVDELEKKGYPLRAQIAKQDVAAAQIKIDAFKELYDNTIKYIPELQRTNEITKETIDLIKDETEENKKLTREQEKRLNQLKELAAEKAKRANIAAENKDITPISEVQGVESTLEVISKLQEKYRLDKLKELNENIIEEQIRQAEKEEDIAKAKEAAILGIKQAATDEAGNYAINAAATVIDNNLAKRKAESEAEKEILKNKLDKGLITEGVYKDRLKKINNKQLIDSARAEKKKALFDIAINTAVAVINALRSGSPPFNFIAAATVGALGAIKAAFVAASPLPKFAKGTEYLNLNGNSKGTDTIPILADEGERIVDKYTNRKLNGIKNEDLPKLINRGLLMDKQAIMPKPDLTKIVINRLDKNNSLSEKMLIALSNGVDSFEIGGYKYTQFRDGSKIIKQQIN